MQIGGVDEKGCIEYLEAFNKYNNAAQRMIMEVHIAYGENADMIGFKACANYLGSN
jgi:hypothetical protein